MGVYVCVCVCQSVNVEIWEEDDGEEHNNHQTCFFLTGVELSDKASQGSNQVNM